MLPDASRVTGVDLIAAPTAPRQVATGSYFAHAVLGQLLDQVIMKPVSEWLCPRCPEGQSRQNPEFPFVSNIGL